MIQDVGEVNALQVFAAGILLRGKKILLGKRRTDLMFYPDVWDIIGGHIEDGETPEQTLLRELGEELGVTPTAFIPIGVLHGREPGSSEDYQCHVYSVTEWSGTPQNMADDEHSEIRWFEIADALHLRLAHPDYPEFFKSLNVQAH